FKRSHFLFLFKDKPNPIIAKPNSKNNKMSQILRNAIATPTATNINITKKANNSMATLIFFILCHIYFLTFISISYFIFLCKIVSSSTSHISSLSSRESFCMVDWTYGFYTIVMFGFGRDSLIYDYLESYYFDHIIMIFYVLNFIFAAFA